MLCYRLRTETVAMRHGATRPVAITLPPGIILSVPGDSANARGFVEVDWDGKRVQMFVVDLRDRGELIKGSAREEHLTGLRSVT